MFDSRVIKIFSEQPFSEYCNELVESIKYEIASERKEYVLNVTEDEYIKSLTSKYKLEELSIMTASAKIPEPHRVTEQRGYGFVEGYQFDVIIPFAGSSVLLKLKPGTRTRYNMYRIIFVDVEAKLIKTSFTIEKKDESEFEKNKSSVLEDCISNVKQLNIEVSNWNTALPKLIANNFKNKKDEYLSENKFFESLNLDIDPNTKVIFNPQPIKKIEIPKPTVDNKTSKFKFEPALDNAMYADILKVIYNLCKSMEKKPATYKDKDEESLRDLIVTFLETRYISSTVSGETFNKSGKTDILIKYEDGTNLFIAECKFWSGEKKLVEAIDQLYNYLTWRDTKTCLIIFVKNKNFSEIIEKTDKTVISHKYFINKTIQTSETSFSFEFHFPDDKSRIIYLELMLFHFN